MKQIKQLLVAGILVAYAGIADAKLNSFGISDIFPTKSDDNATFQRRIQEEMMDGQNLNIHGRHSTNLTLQKILDFIPKLEAYFQNILNTQNHDPKAIKIAQLAIRDIQKAKKMLRPQDVSADDEQDLRVALQKIETKINAYMHDDAVEPEDYLGN